MLVRFDERGEVTEFRLRAADPYDDPAGRRGVQAILLSPSIEICRALLRGEHVPRAALDQEALGRFYSRS